jgi:signal transduction histidine kinase
VLTQAGLGPALVSLAEESPIPMEVEVSLPTDVVATSEDATYRVVVEALADARNRDASYVVVRVEVEGGELVVEIEDDGSPVAQPPVRVADRVGAAGGILTFDARSDGTGSVMRAVLPCA